MKTIHCSPNHDYIIYDSCLVVAVFGAFGNLLTLLAIPWAQYHKILGFNKHTTRKDHKKFPENITNQLIIQRLSQKDIVKST